MYLGIDLGTSSVKTLLVDNTQAIVGSASYDPSVERPYPSWSEQDPNSWILGIEATFIELQRQYSAAFKSVTGIGLSGQQHGATLLNDADKPLRPCILWNDTRSHIQAARLDTRTSQDITGNILFPGFTAPKLTWVAENEPDIFAKTKKVLLPKDYARLWLTGEHVSDMSDAAGTGWLDVANRCWSSELLETTELTTSHMPRLVEGSDRSGVLRKELAEQFGLSSSVFVAGGAGDNAASACGMGNVNPGDAFVSLGTSGVLFASNATFQPNAASAVHTFCHALPNTWHQMGVILSAADSLTWLSQLTGRTPDELTKPLDPTTAVSVDELFLPYLGGERTPHNDATVRGSLSGLSHHSGAEEICRAVLQGVSFAFKDSQRALHDAGTTLNSAFAIGGGSQSNYWVQLLANVLQIPLHVTEASHIGAGFGAARLARLSVTGESASDVCTAPAIAKTFEPNVSTFEDFEASYERFRNAYKEK